MDHSLQKLLMFRVRVGRVSGIDVNLHWSLLLVAIYFLVQFRFDLRLGVLFVMALFGSIFLHELGHCWGARQVGGDAREVVMWPLGGLAMLQVPMAPWPQFVSTVCGPLVNLLLAAAFLPLYFLVGGKLAWLFSLTLPAAGLGLLFLLLVVQLNVILLFFNVIPAFPMDGGRILQTALWPKLGFHKALNVAIIAAIVCAGGMVVVGLWNQNLTQACIGLAIVFYAIHERRLLQYGVYDEELAMSSPWAASLPSYGGSGYAAGDDDGEKKPGMLTQWRERRRERREAEELKRKTELRIRLDEILAKVSAGGMDSLSKEERRFLEHASAELRKEKQQP